LLLVSVITALASARATATPGEGEVFLGRQKMYLSFEITQIESRKQGDGTPANALTDVSYTRNRLVKGVIPFDKPLPGTFPMSSMPLSTAEMVDESRFVGWMVVTPDNAVDIMEQTMQQAASGKVDMSTNPMFLPVEFSIDDVERSHYRDYPAHGFATDTHVVTGRGIAYIGKTGWLACDLKKMTCDLNSVMLHYQQGTDLVTTNSTSDVPGFVPKQETQAPGPLLPTVPLKLLTGFAITLSEPINVTIKDPAQPTVTMRVTLSPNPPPKAAPAR